MLVTLPRSGFIQQQPIDKRRLEQEFINQDRVIQTLNNWINNVEIHGRTLGD